MHYSQVCMYVYTYVVNLQLVFYFTHLQNDVFQENILECIACAGCSKSEHFVHQVDA